MPDYNLGRAHGTVEFTYDGDGVRQAKEDVDQLGRKTTETSAKVQTEDAAMQQSYNNLAAAIKNLSAEVDRHAQSEIVAKERVSAAERALNSVRQSADSTAQKIRDAEKALQQAQTRSTEVSRRLATSVDALGTARKKLNAIPVRKQIADEDTSILDRMRSQFQQIETNTKKSSAGLNLWTNRARLLIGAVAIATPGVAGLAVSLVAVAGVAGVAAGALAAAGAAAATLAIGTSGIGDVFKAASADMKSAGSSAASSAKAQRSAAQAIEQAKRSLQDAEENLQRTQEQAARSAIQAARAILSAQRDLVSAQRDAQRAQDGLTRARREATRQLEDMRLALTGGALDERQALLDVARAQAELNQIMRDPTANESDRQQAILNLEKQQHALEQTRLENQRLADDQASAAAKGVAGSDAVVSAQDEVRSSTQRVADAQQAVVDAQDEARLQQEESARAIRDAVRSVEDAQRQLVDAYADAAESAAGAASKTSEAMQNISPNARAVVSEILDLQDEWKALKFSVQDRLFAGLADDVKPLANIYFPLLQEGAGGIADGFNAMIKNLVDFLKSAEAVDNVRQIFGNTGKAVGNLSTAARDVFAALLDIAAVGSDFLPGMATDANNAAAGFRAFISEARESGKLKEWMQGGIDSVSTLWQLLKNLVGIISTVFTAFDQEGGGALNTLTELTGKVQEFLNSAEGQEALHALGRILASIGGAYGKVFLSFLETAADLLVRLEPFIVAFADAAGIYLAGALQVLGPILNALADVLGFLGPSLGPVVAGIYAANKAVDAAKLAWGALNTVMKANPFIMIAALVVTLALLIIQNWDSITAALSAAWQWLVDLAKEAWGWIERHIVDPLVRAWDAVTKFLTDVKNFFSSSWETLKTNTKNAWNSFWTTIKDTVSGMVRAAGDGLGKIVKFFMDLPGKVLGFLKSLPGKLANWAGDLIDGIVRGLGNMAHKIWQKLKQIVSDAWDSVLDFFGISSPAKEGIWAGEMIGQGLANGLLSSVNLVSSAANTLAEAASISAATFDPSKPSGLAFGMGASGGTVVGMDLPATRAATTTSTSTTNYYIGKVENKIAGNLDPTNPTAWRRAMVEIKNGVRGVDRDYA